LYAIFAHKHAIVYHRLDENNFLALGALRALLQYGWKVPEDETVACCVEMITGLVDDPFMSLVAQPAYEFGVTGIKQLVQRIKTKMPSIGRLQHEMHIRRST